MIKILMIGTVDYLTLILPMQIIHMVPAVVLLAALVVVPLEALPESLRESMGAAWRLRQKNQKVLEEQGKD